MSLGIIATWRGQPLRLGSPFPRALFLDRPRSGRLPRIPRHFLSSTPEDPDEPSSAAPNENETNLNTDAEASPESHDFGTKLTFDALEWAAISQSALVKPAKDLPSAKESIRSQQEHHKSVYRQVRHARFREYIQARPLDWQQVYARLFSLTKARPLEKWIENGLRIAISRSTARKMLQNAGDFTIAAIRLRTHTAISIPKHDPVWTSQPSIEDELAHSTLFVSGSRTAMNQAVDHVRRAAGKVTITRLYSPLGPGETEVETYDNTLTLGGIENQKFNNDLMNLGLMSTPLTRAEGKHLSKRWIDRHVNLTLKPSTWTTASFEAYVEELVDSTVYRHLHSEIYHQKQHEFFLDHQTAVTKRLLELFSIAPAVLVASCSALKIALTYLCTKRSDYQGYGLKLVTIMESRGFTLDAQVFNTLLHSAAKDGDLGRFWFGVKRMLLRGHKPDLDTWLLFLRMTKSREARSIVSQSIRRKNLAVTPEALRSLAKETVMDDIESAIAQKKDLESFLEEQTERYGPDWLTRFAGNAVIHQLCSHNRLNDAFKMLEIMIEASLLTTSKRTFAKKESTPTAATFNTILTHALTVNQMGVAVNVLRKLAHTKAACRYFDPAALDMLFKIAWKSRLRASLVVIWRYASLGRLTTWRMRQYVAALLQGKVGDRKYDMTESVHRALGGEMLARELAGGPEALAQIRKLAKMMTPGGDQNMSSYRENLASLAARSVAKAFLGQFPAVDPGEVLTQSVLVDRRCRIARKQGNIEMLRTAKVKTIPLVKDYKYPSRLWFDFRPEFGVWVRTIEGAQPIKIPEHIGPADAWDDRWDSEGWTLDGDGIRKYRDFFGPPITIIDPRVWADGVDASVVPMDRTETQIHNEGLILKALSGFEKELNERQPRRRVHPPRDESDSRLEIGEDATKTETTGQQLERRSDLVPTVQPHIQESGHVRRVQSVRRK